MRKGDATPGGRRVGGGPPPIPPSGLPGYAAVRRGVPERVRTIFLARAREDAYRRDGRHTENRGLHAPASGLPGGAGVRGGRTVSLRTREGAGSPRGSRWTGGV